MSREWRDRWISAAIGALIMAGSAGAAWATSQSTLAQKLDTDRFVVDSIVQHSRLNDLKASLDRLNATWTKLYCRDHPHDSVCP